jgi:hypothetical protein
MTPPETPSAPEIEALRAIAIALSGTNDLPPGWIEAVARSPFLVFDPLVPGLELPELPAHIVEKHLYNGKFLVNVKDIRPSNFRNDVLEFDARFGDRPQVLHIHAPLAAIFGLFTPGERQLLRGDIGSGASA